MLKRINKQYLWQLAAPALITLCVVIWLSLSSFFATVASLMSGAVQALDVGRDFQGLVLDSSGTAEFLSKFLSSQGQIFVLELEIVPNQGQRLIQSYSIAPKDSQFWRSRLFQKRVRINRVDRVFFLTYLYSPLVFARALGFGIVSAIGVFLLAFLLTDRSKRKAQIQTALAIRSLASQVAHDVRSPLAALEMVLKDVSNLPDEQRKLVRSATTRISDIANSLLNTERTGSQFQYFESTSSQLLSALTELIITEKRLQYRALANIVIESKIDSQAFGLFASISPSEFKRVISNLVNNSVEAIEAGQVTVCLRREQKDVLIEVRDNGKGIPPEILAKLGQQKVTHGKEGTESGTGLGVLHARQCVESWGGKLEIASKLGEGTTFTLRLPLAKQPAWFPGEIQLSVGEQPIVVDDDLSILRVWEGRFSSVGVRNLGHFSSADSFAIWHAGEGKVGRYKFLFDYELLGAARTGLDLIEDYGLAASSILVTSRFEEKAIRDRAERLGVKLLPKGLAAFVPIRIEADTKAKALDAVFLDDDEMMRKSWEYAAKRKKKTILCCATSQELFAKLPEIGIGTPIYIDSTLEAEGIRGEEVARSLHEKGYTNLYLATGYAAAKFPEMPWIKAIVGKEAPWV